MPLQAGMTVNIEPSLYTYDDLSIGGVELEDTILVTETGSRRLTDFPYESRLLALRTSATGNTRVNGPPRITVVALGASGLAGRVSPNPPTLVRSVAEYAWHHAPAVSLFDRLSGNCSPASGASTSVIPRGEDGVIHVLAGRLVLLGADAVPGHLHHDVRATSPFPCSCSAA